MLKQGRHQSYALFLHLALIMLNVRKLFVYADAGTEGESFLPEGLHFKETALQSFRK